MIESKNSYMGSEAKSGDCPSWHIESRFPAKLKLRKLSETGGYVLLKRES